MNKTPSRVTADQSGLVSVGSLEVGLGRVSMAFLIIWGASSSGLLGREQRRGSKRECKLEPLLGK